MAKRSPSDGNQQPVTDSPQDELSVLRDIVFGAAKRDIESRIDALENTVQAEFASLKQTHTDNVAMLQKAIADASDKLSQQLANVDQDLQSKSEELNNYANRLASEIEMAESAGKDDANQLHDRLDKEVRTLSKTFDDKYADAMAKLENVTQELTSTKTDRKTLAKLLATMAVNLETDSDSE